ncbi:uncharacterized protein LJ206_017696 isoform 1-T1 [Theristicus caerulescens]
MSIKHQFFTAIPPPPFPGVSESIWLSPAPSRPAGSAQGPGTPRRGQTAVPPPFPGLRGGSGPRRPRLPAAPGSAHLPAGLPARPGTRESPRNPAPERRQAQPEAGLLPPGRRGPWGALGPPRPPPRGGTPTQRRRLGGGKRQRCFQQAPKRKTRQARPPSGLLCPAGQACPGVGHPRSLRGGRENPPPAPVGTAAPGLPPPPPRANASGLGFFVVVVFQCILRFAQARSRPGPSPQPRRGSGAAGPRPPVPGENRPGCFRAEQPRPAPVLKKREIRRVKKKKKIKSNIEGKKKKVPFRRV